MNRIFAIAFLAIRAAIRSRLFVSLMVVLLAVIIGLPLTIKGDGSAAGQVRILLSYTLGLAAFVMGIATLWVACGAISQEIEDRRIRLVVVKPVYRFQVWFAKWVGLLIINAVLLCFVGCVIYLFLLWNLRSSQVTGEELRDLRSQILVGRTLMPSRAPSLDKDAERLLYFLANFNPLLSTFVPRHSILREFIGDSGFKY